MPLPEPECGLVISYSYLWKHESDAGQTEGVKDRPCAIVLAVEGKETRAKTVTVAPITHTPPSNPSLAIEIPPRVKQHLGLDAMRSWIVVEEFNEFVWPGFDLRPVPGKPSRYDYGFPGAAERLNNIIIRPHGDNVQFVQLDDLDAAALSRVGEAAFLTLETSPGNHQAWVAVSGIDGPAEAKDFARRLRKGAGADHSASGATRVAGTTNYKRKYEPDFPTVKIVATAPGRIVTKEQLEAMGLVAASEPEIAAPAFTARTPQGRTGQQSATRKKVWPDYARSLAGAPPSRDGSGPDRSMADFTWCMTAIDWGFPIEETAAKLPEVSEKARERVQLRDEGYPLITAQNAAAAVERNALKRGRG